MRPQGFLGRLFARDRAAILQVDEDPNRWSDDALHALHALHALSLLGDDTAGNLLIGEAAYRRWLASMNDPGAPVGDADLEVRYAALADSAMRHGAAGPSVGGECPKFTATRQWAGAGEIVRVIVKFSGNDRSDGTRRCSGLLVCEHLAGRVVAELLGPIRSAESTVHQAAGRTFLEVVRFDRHGAFGRSGLVSLQSLDGALVGTSAGPWPATVQRLEALRLLVDQVGAQTRLLWLFGRLIANTDMHQGNLSFVPAAAGQTGLRLAPVYDMLPMLYAPARGVEAATREFDPPLPLSARAFARPAPRMRARWRRPCGIRRARVRRHDGSEVTGHSRPLASRVSS